MTPSTTLGAGFARAAPAYFVPQPSRWPIRLAIALAFVTSGTAAWMNRAHSGPYVLALGTVLLALVLIGWFGAVLGEGNRGLYSAQVDRAMRWGMASFIFTEAVFFSAMFGALFYMRQVSVPDLAHGVSAQLWPGYAGGWPTAGPGGRSPQLAMSALGVPAINTLILLCSGAAITVAGHAIARDARGRVAALLAFTAVVGVVFIGLQASEYRHAWGVLNLTLAEGAYGATFYILTGFHGLHVAVGTTMVLAILARTLRGHITRASHFALDAVSWYWHFVGVVWLLLYIVVYVL